MCLRVLSSLLAIVFLCGPISGFAQTTDQIAAERALKRCTTYFRSTLSVQGSYLWKYSADQSYREGEGEATDTQGWVQPPGTPSVGEAYLTAYRATGDEFYLDAAVEVASALVATQLQSGGWDYRIEFDPRQRSKYAYRVDGNRSGRNTTTLDDNTTQSAIRFLMHADAELDFKNRAIHEAVIYALDQLAAAQYPNGAWPQRFSEPPDPAEFPVLKASYPESWSRTFPSQQYKEFYTFNDNAIADDIDVMFEAGAIYDSATYRKSAERGGDFILLAQMPEPQPAWAQQYDRRMHPAWARKFEPPSVTGGESQGVIQTLLMLYQKTGKDKYLKPIPVALDYLQNSKRTDGRLARFYELQTNKPLYFTIDYQLTYSDKQMPTHYGFVVSSKLDKLQAQYEKLAAVPIDQLDPPRSDKPPRLSRSLQERARKVIAAMNSEGAWIETSEFNAKSAPEGRQQLISSRTFVQNVTTLCEIIRAEP